MQPSGLATLTSRFQVAVSSTGNLSLVFYPWADAPVLGSTTAQAPYSYNRETQAAFPGASSLGSIATGGRVVAAGIRVFTLSSATNDQGLITIGCLPRDTINNASDFLTNGGFPYDGTTTVATQGFNEFNNYLSTESYPLRCGASAVYRPEDPLDYTFRTLITSSGFVDVSTFGTPLLPFFVVGVTGADNSSVLFCEIIAHIEYTVNEGTTGVVNTGMGNMDSVGSFASAKSIFSGFVDSTFQGVTGGLSTAAAAAGKRLAGGDGYGWGVFLFFSPRHLLIHPRQESAITDYNSRCLKYVTS
jgi:hypothetical protein